MALLPLLLLLTPRMLLLLLLMPRTLSCRTACVDGTAAGPLISSAIAAWTRELDSDETSSEARGPATLPASASLGS